MARNCVAASNHHILVGDIAALDFTDDTWAVGGMFRRTSNGAEHKIAAKWAGGDSTLQYLISINGADVLIGAIHDGTGIQVAAGTTSIVTGQWYHALLRQNGSALDLFLDGVLEANTTVAAGPHDTTTPFILGTGGDGVSHENPADADLAEWAAWSVAPTDAEVAALGKRISPVLIRPQSRTFYAPLVRELIDVHGATLTNSGTTVVPHTRMFYAGRPWVARTPAGGAVAGQPMAKRFGGVPYVGRVKAGHDGVHIW